MKTSPFIYGMSVTNAAFTDRKDETEKLSDNVTGGINTILISSGRCGTTSLVEKVMAER